MTERPAFACLLPHAPVLVPEIGGPWHAQCEATWRACTEIGARLRARHPQSLLLVSPHAPRRPGSFGFYASPILRGDLRAFGGRDAGVAIALDEKLLRALEDAAAERGIETWRMPPQGLDHGAVVPLHFLLCAGGPERGVVVSLPSEDDLPSAVRFGEAIGALRGGNLSVLALVASGDCSHRLAPDAPQRFDPRAAAFDAALREALVAGKPRQVLQIDPALRAAAAEDAAASVSVIAAACGFACHGAEVLSYEHPFGVGYLVAVLDDGTPR